MDKDEQDVAYVDDGKEKTKENDWDDNTQKYQEYMEGFFDYKDKLINPASEKMAFKPEDVSDFMDGVFKLINRDLQLGNLDRHRYTVVYQHFHLGTELMRFGLFDAGVLFIQKGFTLLTLSNSIGGFQRKLESTNISVRKLQTDQTGKGDNKWLKAKRKKR